MMPVFNTPMPGSTQRAHFTPARGDCHAAIMAVGRKALGSDKIKALDANLQAIKVKLKGIWVWRVVLGHWGVLGRDGYTHWVDSKGKHHALVTPRMARKARRSGKKLTVQTTMSYQQWINDHGGSEESLHLLRKRNGNTVLTWEAAVTIAKRNGVVLCGELKSRAFATTAALAEYMVAVCRRLDYPCWVMSLLSMWNAQGKCQMFRTAGADFALIFGRFRNQAKGANKIVHWTNKPDQIWGPASARQWLKAA